MRMTCCSIFDIWNIYGIWDRVRCNVKGRNRRRQISYLCYLSGCDKYGSMTEYYWCIEENHLESYTNNSRSSKCQTTLRVSIAISRNTYHTSHSIYQSISWLLLQDPLFLNSQWYTNPHSLQHLISEHLKPIRKLICLRFKLSTEEVIEYGLQ